MANTATEEVDYDEIKEECNTSDQGIREIKIDYFTRKMKDGDVIEFF